MFVDLRLFVSQWQSVFVVRHLKLSYLAFVLDSETISLLFHNVRDACGIFGSRFLDGDNYSNTLNNR